MQIKCKTCGEENNAGAKFCAKCGKNVLLNVVCPKCENKTSANAKFCDKCGYSLAEILKIETQLKWLQKDEHIINHEESVKVCLHNFLVYYLKSFRAHLFQTSKRIVIVESTVEEIREHENTYSPNISDFREVRGAQLAVLKKYMHEVSNPIIGTRESEIDDEISMEFPLGEIECAESMIPVYRGKYRDPMPALDLYVSDQKIRIGFYKEKTRDKWITIINNLDSTK